MWKIVIYICWASSGVARPGCQHLYASGLDHVWATTLLPTALPYQQ